MSCMTELSMAPGLICASYYFYNYCKYNSLIFDFKTTIPYKLWWELNVITFFWWLWKLDLLCWSLYSFFLLNLIFIVFLHYHLVPLYTPLLSSYHTVVCVRESFFLFGSIFNVIFQQSYSMGLCVLCKFSRKTSNIFQTLKEINLISCKF